MAINKALRENLEEHYPDIVLWDDLDEAFLGVGHRFNQVYIAVYSVQKIIESLEKQGMTNNEAVEYFDYNVQGAWIGNRTPIHVVEID